MIKAGVKVPDFTSDLLKGLSVDINSKLFKLTNNRDFISFIKNEITSRIKATKHYQSLISGELRGEFGLVDPYTQMELIINELTNSISINFNPLDDKLNGGLSVEISFEGLNGLGTYYSNGNIVDWLDWLLTGGTSMVVADFSIIRGNFQYGRTGQALMVPGGSYTVPAEFAGTDGSNWLTEAFKGIEEVILERISEVL